MKLLISLAALALLASCDQPPREAADGYRFEQAEWQRSELAVSVVVHPDVEALRIAARAAGAKVEVGRELMAFGEITSRECRIHVIEPSDGYAPEWIGHEMAHCIWGRWHR